MRQPIYSEIDVSPTVVLSRLTGWTAGYRSDPCSAAAADVLVAFAFLVGLQAGVGRPDAARRALGSLAKEQPAAFRRSADLAMCLFAPEPCARC